MIVKWQSDTPKMVKWQSDAPKMELKVPSEIKIDGGGYPPYELPVATKEVLGGVKVDGDTINITSDGVISTQKVDLSGVATKVELEEKVSDSVKYTPQTLTDEQKKQARENMGAVDTANGLLPVECILPWGTSTSNKTVFVKNGVMLPLDYSTATGDMKTAISRFGLLMMAQTNITPGLMDTLVKSFATLIENGIFGDDFYNTYVYPSNTLYIYDSPFSPKTEISLWNYYKASDSQKGFALRVANANGNTFTRAYNTTTAEYANNYIDYTSTPLATYASEFGDTPYIQQVEMKANPTTDMQIATKKYVDDHAGGGGGEAQLNYNISSTATFTEQDKEVIKSAIKFGTGFFIDNFKVIRIMSIGSRKVFIVLKPNGATDNHVVGYQVDVDADKNVTSSVFSTFIDYVLIGSNSAISGDIITSDNWETYININAGDWIQTTKNDSNLYNAKQLWVIGLDGQNYYEGIYRFDYSAATTVLGDCTSVQFSLGDFTFSYDGTSLNPYLGTILAVYYKT